VQTTLADDTLALQKLQTDAKKALHTGRGAFNVRAA
jgi:hypothetical protein